VIFPREATRPARQALFHRRHLANHVPHGCSFVHVADDGGVLATVTVRPPGGIRVPPMALLRGLLALALASGPGVIRRLLRVGNMYEEPSGAVRGLPYWHVHMMGAAGVQGKGIGSQVLDDALKSTARVPAPIVLTTHKPINLRFYERAGFRVTHEEHVALAGAAPYTVWCMRRDPRGA
jgi:GNAT superfamily N-acetyltransferase